MRIGILALQGDFAAHARRLSELGLRALEVRYAAQMECLDGLVLPGGESTTALLLLEQENLWEPLRQFAEEKPILGTCAGAILLATEVLHPPQRSLGAMDIRIERNAYGRQLESAVRWVDPEEDFVRRTHPGRMEAVFIRAPIIRATASGVKVLAKADSHPILVEQGRHLAATFHPELTTDTRLHELFLSKVRKGRTQDADDGTETLVR